MAYTYQFKLLSSLEKVFFDKLDAFPETTSASMLQNEIHSFQLAAWTWGPRPPRIPCKLEIDSELAPWITAYNVGYVPNRLATYGEEPLEDHDYITKTPGLFPDPLHRIVNGEMELAVCQARSFWFQVEPKGEITGTYPITVRIRTEEGELLTEQTYTLTILPVSSPELPIFNTGWFHGDCLATHHGVELQSDEYFAIVEKYLDNYTHFGHNTILTPVFTPPLDTKIGGERPTNQLVGVTVTKGVYSFDFSLLRRWIQLCLKHGVKFFELSHLYSQWGARYAPKVMATVDGEYKRIFGWETDALGEEYTAFMNAFLPELVTVLKEEGILDQCLFHVSDEPHAEHAQQYGAARQILCKYLPADQFIDALRDYSLYESGAVTCPVVSNNRIHTFMEKGVHGLWTYYCCSQCKDVSNRFMAMPSYRNRVLGAQLYKYQNKGFLHWGYNFWYSQYSVGSVDPYRDSTADGGFPGGDAFVVYPLNENGEVVSSLRLYVFLEAMQDLRAMKLLESLTSREEVLALLEDLTNFDVFPRNSEFYLNLRETINRKIAEKL